MQTFQHKTLLAVLLLSLFGLASFNANADQTELDGTRIPGAVYSGFDANWRKYATLASKVDGGFAVIPNYDRRHESSRGISTSQAMEMLKVEKEVRQGNLVRTRVAYPDRADAEAYSKALPELTAGQYGWIASVEVVKIIDRKQMIVKDIWLVDRPTVRAEYEKDRKQSARENDGKENKELLEFNYAKRIEMVEQQEDRDEGFDRQFRLVGYDTRGLRVGDRWKGRNDEGFKVAVAYWETPEPDEEEEGSRRSRRAGEPRLVLTEVEELMRKTLDEKGFKELLQARGMTVVDFVDLVRTVRENDRRNAEERIINALLPPVPELDD
jgi:hypothetical protein